MNRRHSGSSRPKMKYTDTLKAQYSSISFLAYCALSTVVSIGAIFNAVRGASINNDGGIMLIFSGIIHLISVVAGWLIWTVKTSGVNKTTLNKTKPVRFIERILPSLQIIFVISGEIAVAFRALSTVMFGQCGGRVDGNYGHKCNPYQEHGIVRPQIILALMIIPLAGHILLRDINYKAIVASVLIGAGSLVACAIMMNSDSLLLTVVITLAFSGIIFHHNWSQSNQVYDLFVRLEVLRTETQRKAEEDQASELRAMIGNVAHDLKTPLTSILNGVEFLLDIVKSWEGCLRGGKEKNAARREFVSQAAENFESIRGCLTSISSTNSLMTMTINRCLDYTKANRGLRLVPKYETIDLNEATDTPIRIINTFQTNFAIRLEPWSENNGICSHIITDRGWFIENMLCLLSNAVKYSSKGNVDVRLLLTDTLQLGGDEPQTKRNSSPLTLREKEGAPRQFLRVEVQDTGIGLSDEAMQSLFNPFKQAQRLAGGTGLGLFSLAKRMEAISGSYGVSRRPDGQAGSLFWFSIPYRPDDLMSAMEDGKPLMEEDEEEGQEQDRFSVQAPLATAGRSDSSRLSREGSMRLSKAHSMESLSMRSNDSTGTNGVETGTPGTITPTGAGAGADGGSVNVSILPLNILVVDDAPSIQKMTKMLLTKKGHKVTQAVNGAEGLEMMLDNRYTSSSSASSSTAAPPDATAGGEEAIPGLGSPVFDVVLMDLQMPIMDGPEAIRRLRAAERNYAVENGITSGKSADVDLELGGGGGGEGSLKRAGVANENRQFIIALSANSDHDTMQAALEAGADLFISKPFSYVTFVEACNQNLRRR